MKVSLNTIKRFTTVDIPVNELVETINQKLGGVEETTDLGSRYEGAVIAKVVSCKKHDNADKLNVCMVDDGTGEQTQVVCGAPNVREGMFVVWLKPGCTVPSTAEDAEPFVLSARELRGVTSNGMLASPKELGLGDSHEGILEIDPTEWNPSGAVIAPGLSFAETFGLNDTTIDIENKMFTHRPDLFGQLGVAREIAGIQHIPFVSPDWYMNENVEVAPIGTESLDLTVFNEAGEKVPRFMTVVVSGVIVKPSPVWLQVELVRLGGKPINNIVDATNYIMLMTAQPTHAYDYDKLRGHTLGARMATENEKVKLLNGKTYELTVDDIVIADGEGPVGLGGVMGSGESEVSNATTNIVLEVANFDMYTVRKSSMRHGVFTDALTRFNKGQSPLQNPIILKRLLGMIMQVAGGQPASQIFDTEHQLTDASSIHAVDFMTIEPSFINDRLGLQLTAEDIASLLRNVEFKVEIDGGTLEISEPFWRTDIELPEDIVEEVGRLYGYDRLPRELPKRNIKPAAINSIFATKQSTRQLLSKAGANEVLTYSFVHEKLLERAGQDKALAFKLSNALSPDLQYYRLGLTPSLLDKVHMNSKAGYDEFALFELGKVHFKGEMDSQEPSVPNEDTHVSLVIIRKNEDTGASFYGAKRYLEEIVDFADSQLTPMSQFDMTNDDWGRQLAAAYDPERSALIVKDEQVWGVVGEFKAEVRRAFKLPVHAAGFEVHVDVLTTGQKQYRPLSRYPSVTQDVSIRSKGVAFAKIAEAVDSVIAIQPEHLSITVTPMVIYRPTDGDEVTTTFRIVVTSHLATLATGDVRPIVEAIDLAAKQGFDGRVI